MKEPIIESGLAKKVAIWCFNKAWDYLEKGELNNEEKIELLNLVHSSLWLWTQVNDHTTTNLSIGYWQVSRAYAKLKDGLNAVMYGKKCVEISKESSVEPFFLAYGYEALCRGLILLDKKDEAHKNLITTKENLKLSKEKEKEGLITDIKELEESLAV